MKNLKINKGILIRLKYASFGIVLGILGSKIVSDNVKDNTMTIIVKEDMTVKELSKKLNYKEELLRDLNKKIDKTIKEGQEIILNKEEISPLSYQSYTLQKGDTLTTLSDNFGVTESSLKKMDKILESNNSIKEHIGEEVVIYSANEDKKETISYTVEYNDNLTMIAEKLHTTVDKIMKENMLESDVIYPNQVLQITAELTSKEKEALEKREEKVEKEKKTEKEPKTMVTKKEQEEQTYGNLKGIDVSRHQESIDFEQVKEYGIDYVIINMFDSYFMDYERDSETGDLVGNLSQLDSCFLQNIERCEENNIPYGIYIYSRAVTEEQAKVEAKKFLKFASKYQIHPTYPIYYDVESNIDQPFYDEKRERLDSVRFINEHSEQVLKNFKAFAIVLEKNNYYCGIYTNDDTINKLDQSGTELEKYAIWLAKFAYGPEVQNGFEENVTIRPDYKGNYSMYQFSQSGAVPGVNGFVDCNYCKVNYDEIIQKAGMNQPLQEEVLNKVLTKK